MNEPVPFDSPAVERGVGFFETILLAGTRAVLWEPHVARLHRTLAKLELPAPSVPRLLEAAARALRREGPTDEERGLRLSWIAVGSELDREESWRLDASTRAIPAGTLKRRPGSHAVTLPPELRRDTPGYKSTSYFAALMGLRYAARHGGDEGLFVDDAGFYLEGCSTALVVWAEGERLQAGSAALPSVTAAAFCHDARPSDYPLTADHVRSGALLLGSLTKAAPILSLDGRPCEVPTAMRAAADEFNSRLVADATFSTALD